MPAWPWTVPVGELVLKLSAVVGAALEVVLERLHACALYLVEEEQRW